MIHNYTNTYNNAHKHTHMLIYIYICIMYNMSVYVKQQHDHMNRSYYTIICRIPNKQGQKDIVGNYFPDRLLACPPPRQCQWKGCVPFLM